MTSSGSVAFDRAADYYDKTRGFPPGEEQNVAALISRVGGWNDTSRVLEVAVGTGRIALPLSKRLRTIYGIDLSRPMMNRLRAKQPDEPVRLTEGDITRLPFKSASVDGALAVHVFHLISDWRGALREIARVLRPGAVFVHGRNDGRYGNSSAFDALEAAIKTQIPDYEEDVVGARNIDDDQFLIEEGWRRVGEIQFHEIPLYVAPQRFLEALEQRTSSRSWRLSDEDLARIVDAVRTTLHEQFEDPHKEIELKTNFRAAAYLPPVN